jgi:hypothetical protein
VKRFIGALLFGAVSVPNAVDATPLKGYDALGLAKYCRTFLAAPSLPAVSTLLDTFGDPLPCLDRALKRGKTKLVQIDLRDATCVRNRVCPPNTPPLTDWKYLRQKAQQVNSLARKHREVEWWVSPFLEHDFADPKVILRACSEVSKGCPRCLCINSPFLGARPKGLPIELHGTKTRSFMVSADGSSSFDADNLNSDGNGFQHRTSGEYVTFAWWPELNLRCTGQRAWVFPNDRTTRPTKDQFEHAFQLMKQEQRRPTPPPQCRRIKRLSKESGEIHKTNAEQFCNGLPALARGNKPTLIIEKSGRLGDRLNLLNSDGESVGCYAYGGPFQKLHRWYLGTCSGQTPIELYKDLGSEWGWVNLGGGDCLEVNAIRRSGVYR